MTFKRLAMSFLICWMLVLPHSSFAETDSMGKENAKWFESNYKYIEQELRKGDERTVVPIVNALGSTFAIDSRGTYNAVYPTIAIALIHQTELMLLWFSEYDLYFDIYLEFIDLSLLTTGFVGFSGMEGVDEKSLIKLRIELIDALERYRESSMSEDLVEMANRLLQKLYVTDVRR